MLVNFTFAKLNIKARQREIDDLNEIRTELAGDTERVKILDELIDDARREKVRNELAG